MCAVPSALQVMLAILVPTVWRVLYEQIYTTPHCTFESPLFIAGEIRSTLILSYRRLLSWTNDLSVYGTEHRTSRLAICIFILQEEVYQRLTIRDSQSRLITMLCDL